MGSVTSTGMNRCAGGVRLQSQRELEKLEQRPLPGVVVLSHHPSAMCCGTASSCEAAGTQQGTGDVPGTQVRRDLRDSTHLLAWSPGPAAVRIQDTFPHCWRAHAASFACFSLVTVLRV